MKYSIVFTAILPIFCHLAGVRGKYVERDDGNITDVDVLNFALTLEHLENAFYSQALQKFSAEDFASAGYPPWVRGRYQQVAAHEKTHVDFLTTALKGAGATPVEACTYKFPYNDPKSFVTLSAAFETVGTSAYSGAAAFISNKDYLTAAGTILAVEARHSGWIDSAVEKGAAWSGPFEVPLDPNQAFTIASQFIDSCPSSNPTLIAKAFPSLAVSPSTAQAGEKVTLQFESSSDSVYAAFLTSNLGTLIVPINSDKSVTFPDNLRGTVFIIVTSDSTKVTDETTVAGPALLMLPLPSSEN